MLRLQGGFCAFLRPVLIGCLQSVHCQNIILLQFRNILCITVRILSAEEHHAAVPCNLLRCRQLSRRQINLTQNTPIHLHRTKSNLVCYRIPYEYFLVFFKKHSPQVLEILLTVPLIEYLHELLHQRAGKRIHTTFQRHTVNRPMQNLAIFFGLLRVLGQFLMLCDIGIDALGQRTVFYNQGCVHKAPALLEGQILLSLDRWLPL